MITTWAAVAALWVVDFEFSAPPGECPRPICCVGTNLRTGERRQVWFDHHLAAPPAAPYDTGPADVLVAYFASAEIGCLLALGWPRPAHVLDLYTEFRLLTNGRPVPCGHGLLGACAYFGLALTDATKTAMRDLAIRGGPYTPTERAALLAYCGRDVEATAALFARMYPGLDLPRALLRGRYMAACAAMERTGVPLDVPILDTLRESWDAIKGALITEVDTAYGVFDGHTFKHDRFERYLTARGIPWERTDTGALKLDDQTWRERARAFPELDALRELRASLAQLRLADLAVGTDGRNRTLLSPFGAKTGRNAPSTSRFVFGPSTWLRHLIRPPQGWALAYLDWSQQEFGIAAALSGDAVMRAAYASGDPYLAFAQQAGAVPPGATKTSHAAVRDQFKACVLAVQYGMGSDTLARRIGQSPAHAAHLLTLHRQTYPAFWHWSEHAVMFAMLTNQLHSVFGWTLHVSEAVNPRTLQNYPMQANGAEMLRLACCTATEAGVRVCAPVHDALLIEAPAVDLENAIHETQRAMTTASEVVLNGFALRSSVTRIPFPQRFTDPRGVAMWQAVQAALHRQVGVEVATWN